MKKLVLLLSLSLVLNGCKQKEAKTESDSEKPQMMVSPVNVEKDNCSIFNAMDSLTVSQQVSWLRENQAEICQPQYDVCRENMHKITQKEFSDAVSAYWGTTTVVYTNIELENIKALTPTVEYQKYIRAEADSSNNITLTAVTDFNIAKTQYSVPLFYSIGRMNSLDGKTVFSFTLAKIDGQTRIVFVVNAISQCFDLCNNPT